MKVYLGQINTAVGDISHNLREIKRSLQEAKSNNYAIALFPELTISGYPPKDLLFNPDFLESCANAMESVKNMTKEIGIYALVGAPRILDGNIYNSAFLIGNGSILHTADKHMLPNYGVFDERRYFTPGNNFKAIALNKQNIAIMICEDIWHDDVIHQYQSQHIDAAFVINSSPFEPNKAATRHKLAMNLAKKLSCAVYYVNQLGGQDDLVFDGGSFAIDSSGEFISKPFFWSEKPSDLHWDELSHTYQALLTGVRDYFAKSGFNRAILGLSGGIDSALVATIACDALGSNNVIGVRMPSKYSSQHSLDDAQDLASRLNINLYTKPITNLQQDACDLLQLQKSISEENLQSRIRGMIIMALSSEHNALALTTGNKSEYATGYATLYGDMCGAYAPLKDIYKTLVYKLANWRQENIPFNSNAPIKNPIPNNSITKAPSAELRPNQTDQDSLPEYEILDGILQMIVENNLTFKQIIAKGYRVDDIQKVQKLLKLSEFKRKQSAPGPKVTKRDLSLERRFPICNGY